MTSKKLEGNNVLRKEWSTVSHGAKKKKKSSKVSMIKDSLDLEMEKSLVASAKSIYLIEGVESIGTYIKG